jgi:phosphoglycerate dehydrogenase-like enzyme
MDNITVLVLANPADPQLKKLASLPEETSIAVGDAAQAFARTAAQAGVLFNWSESGLLFREVFTMCPQLRWVHSRAAGLDNLLFPEIVESPVPLTNGSGVFSPPLGEFVLGAMLYFAQDFRRLIRCQAARVWEARDIEEIAGRTVGIVGYGDIGRAVSTRAHALGMHVLALRRTGPPLSGVDPLIDQFYGPATRLEMIPRCDYLVVSAPLTPETRGLIGAAEFAAMQPHAVVINIGRGPVIDEAALIDALTTNRIRGAALDVFDTEPLPEGHPFYALENVLLSPHCADHTPDWLDRAMQFFLDQFERLRQGEPLLNVVDKRRGY